MHEAPVVGWKVGDGVRAWLAGTLVIAIAALGAAGARAQNDSPGSPSLSDDPSETVYRAEEIVVEDTREAERPTEVFADTPVQREVLARPEVERRPGTSAADLLRTLPGVRQQQRVQGEEAAVSIEGLPPEFTRALVDGERYTGEIGAADDFRTLPTFGAERVEVLRGAQALRYGSDAAGGVVRIDTPDPPRDGLRGRFEGGYGGSSWIYGAGSIGWGSERAGAWLRFVDDEIDGFDGPDGFVPQPPGAQSRRVSRDLYGKLRLDPLDALGLVTRFGWRRDDESGLSGEGDAGDREETRWLVGQHGAWRLGEATRLVGTFTWYDNALRSDVGRSYAIDEHEPSGRLALEHLLATGPVSHALTVGFDAFAPHLALEDGASGGRLEKDQRYGGVYAIAESELARWLQLEGGVRAQFHDAYAPRVLPQLAVLVSPWRPDEARFLRLRASWGMGYRTPTLRELHQPPVPQVGGLYFLAGNPDLEPELVESFRAGFEWAPLERATLSVTAFRNEIEDHIRSVHAGLVFVDGRPASLYRKTNLDEVTTQGVETRVRVRPHRLVDLEAAYTWLDTEVSDATCPLDELPNEPHHVVDLLAGVELPRVRTRVAALGRWRGEALTERSGTGSCSFASLERSDPSFVLDLRLVQPLGASGVDLYVDLFNVTDEDVVDSYAVRGRTLFVGLRGRF